MEGVSTDDIRAALSRVKVANNLAAGLVMLACLWRRRGEDGAWMADMLQVPRSTIIHGRLARMHRGGLDARYGRHDDPEITGGPPQAVAALARPQTPRPSTADSAGRCPRRPVPASGSRQGGPGHSPKPLQNRNRPKSRYN